LRTKINLQVVLTLYITVCSLASVRALTTAFFTKLMLHTTS
jgi:hypothetical protein